jgi:hypothetical protein
MEPSWFRQFYDCYTNGIYIQCKGPYETPNKADVERSFQRGIISKLVPVHPFLPVKLQVWWHFANVGAIRIEHKFTEV